MHVPFIRWVDKINKSYVTHSKGGIMSEKYDLIVVGAGNGGLMTACRASRMGLKTLVV